MIRLSEILLLSIRRISIKIADIQRIILFFLLIFFVAGSDSPVMGQVLSGQYCGKDSPLYTVYASATERTSYILDQGYSLAWTDPEKPVGFESKDGGNFYLAFLKDSIYKGKLKEFYREPLIKENYPDLVRLSYYPFDNLRVDLLFVVYSSSQSVAEVTLTNESGFPLKAEVIPYFTCNPDTVREAVTRNNGQSLLFEHHKTRDGWMKEHNIPLKEELRTLFHCSQRPQAFGILPFNPKEEINSLIKSSLDLRSDAPLCGRMVFFQKLSFSLAPDSCCSFRLVRSLQDSKDKPARLFKELDSLMVLNIWDRKKADDDLFSRIPAISTGPLQDLSSQTLQGPDDRDLQLLYYSCFSLMRQCMMGPEGECRENYYVFSREPKWGWGYGGQVFHESLSMLAYAMMDPLSAMNSQRIFMQRQHPDGYINYRTGPYLNETIETNGKLTSSAPWYNYQNYEIFRITKDRKFLEEAYRSGKKFYQYFTAHRDSDNDGLFEWGANAELESVRDARVAVWDEVWPPSEVEGPDLNSMLVMEARSLSAMATELGLTEEATQWKEKADQLSRLINQFMWDEETGFYYNISKKNHSFTFKSPGDLKRKEIIGFLPLWAGVASPSQAGILMKSLLNPEEFNRSYGIPTLSAADPYYNPMGYWNGPVWIPWQYLVVSGLLDYGYKKQATEITLKVATNVIRQLKTDHCFWEFYSPDAHQAGWNRSYIWTGLLARMMWEVCR
ncbi:MAG: trehalase family glycosidase [Bacteroidetes bacterium]|nr:trehalase family glycosidase [Bacteroidota bacterium]